MRSGTPARERAAPAGFAWPLPGIPVAFVPVTGPSVREQREASSYVNPREAEAVMNVLQQLLGAGELQPHGIGIVTPYAAQVRLLRRMIRQRGIPNGIDQVTGKAGVEVSSVDGYQGREKDLMIVSTVRSNDQGNLGFVSDPRRCCVTLTRAKRGLVVCGDPKTLLSDREVWGRWLDWAAEAGPHPSIFLIWYLSIFEVSSGITQVTSGTRLLKVKLERVLMQGTERRADWWSVNPGSRQGLTLVHFSAHLEAFVWNRVCAAELCSPC